MIFRILGGIALSVLALTTACGQKGDLLLPTEAASQGRATLPEVFMPGKPAVPPRPHSPPSIP